MFKRRSQSDDVLRCSFCRKSQDSVQKLISSPSDEKSYICDECIAVCNSILEDERNPPEGLDEAVMPHPLLDHPRTSQLLWAVERWIRRESLGIDAAEELSEIRAAAIKWTGSSQEDPK
jgi:hypothetical protein